MLDVRERLREKQRQRKEFREALFLAFLILLFGTPTILWVILLFGHFFT